MGFAKAMGAALFAEKLPAKEAAELGLIWECVPDDAFEAAWKARGEYLAKGPTMSFANIKKAMRASLTNSLEEQLALEAHLQGECGRSRDFKEGVLASIFGNSWTGNTPGRPMKP